MRAFLLCAVALLSICGDAFATITVKNANGQEIPVKAGTYTGSVSRVATKGHITYFIHCRKNDNPTGDECTLIVTDSDTSFSSEEKQMLDEGDRENDGDNFADIATPSGGNADVTSTGTGPR